jgi:aminomethyltransferase
MVDFAGWEMPIRYAGIREEHDQTRASGSIFDVSHMGRLELKGLHARRAIEHLCSRRVSNMQNGQCKYALVCNDTGGVKDDIIVYRFDDDDYLVVCNGANRDKIVAHFQQVIAARAFKVKLDDVTMRTAMVAIQGPRVMDLIGKVSREIPSLKRYRFTVKNLLVVKLIVSRTGYTGEDGVEVILPAPAVGMALKLLLKDVNTQEAQAMLKPAGLGARDTLRMEAAMPLYGHELGEDINALSCAVDFAIDLDKSEATDGERFIGQAALESTKATGGPRTRLVGIEVDSKRTARQGMTIEIGPGTPEHRGVVTSGCLSPTLGKSIAMGLIPAAHAADGTPLRIVSDRGTLDGRVVPMPFYKAKKP